MDLRIAAFIAVSTLAHGGAVLWFDAGHPPRLPVGGEARALRVALQPAVQTIDRNDTEARPAAIQPLVTSPTPSNARQLTAVTSKQRITESSINLAVTHTASGPQHADRAAQDTPPQTVPEPPATNRDTAASRHSSAENVSEHISAALKNRLAHNFEYPWLARKHGWQGRVLLSLRVASNGDLSGWKVVRTSGYRTLDQSALKAVQRIGHLPQAERWLKGESLEVRLPVQYTLLDS